MLVVKVAVVVRVSNAQSLYRIFRLSLPLPSICSK